MKKLIFAMFMAVSLVSGGISFADDPPIPITAEQAFDAVQNQSDPISGESTRVALIDVRSRAEFFWVGAACQVDEIITSKEESIIPDNGKVLISQNGRFLVYEVDGRNKRFQTKNVKEINLSPIAINIPFKFWNEDKVKLDPNTDFAEDIEALEDYYDVLIFFCRSGGRSQDCVFDEDGNAVFDITLFDEIYEIDQPDGTSGRGGFEGSNYGQVYNGYRGFPERLTEIQDHPSVSWKDTGLPMKTSVNPLAE